VILADEPVASLDPALADEIISLLVRVGSEGRRTLVVALHKVELVLQYFPRVIGLRAGTLCFDRPVASVDEDLLLDLYAGHQQEPRRVPDEDRFQREFGCARSRLRWRGFPQPGDPKRLVQERRLRGS